RRLVGGAGGSRPQPADGVLGPLHGRGADGRAPEEPGPFGRGRQRLFANSMRSLLLLVFRIAPSSSSMASDWLTPASWRRIACDSLSASSSSSSSSFRVAEADRSIAG